MTFGRAGAFVMLGVEYPLALEFCHRCGYNGLVAENRSLFRHLMRASMVGIQLVVATFVGFFIGRFLDRLLGTFPWLTIVFLILGLVAGFRDLFRMAKEDEGADKKGR